MNDDCQHRPGLCPRGAAAGGRSDSGTLPGYVASDTARPCLPGSGVRPHLGGGQERPVQLRGSGFEDVIVDNAGGEIEGETASEAGVGER